MKPYPSYKNSGVEWIGEIPQHWDISKLKRYFSVSSGDFHSSYNDSEDGYPIYGGNGFRGYSLEYNSEGKMILIGRVGAKCGNIHIVDGKYWVSEHALRVFPKKKFSTEYFGYLLESINLNQYAIQTAQPLINSTIVIDRHCSFPPIQEQQNIVFFLDHKIQKIDELIEKTEKKIELLKEKRTSIINHCVTKGLNPNVEMKDSEVEWIGEIPREWKISRLDFLCDLFGRVGWKALKSDEYVEEGYIFLSTPNIKNNEIDYENVNYITEERYLESPEIMLENGDVLLVKDGSTLGIVNIVRNLPRPTTVNSSIGVLKNKSSLLFEKFLYYFLLSHYSQNIINRIKGGMGVPHLFQADIKKFVVLLPDKNEQKRIVECLDEQTHKIDTSIKKEIQRIELLKEYRQSIISEVVTGKVDVRDEVVV